MIGCRVHFEIVRHGIGARHGVPLWQGCHTEGEGRGAARQIPRQGRDVNCCHLIAALKFVGCYNKIYEAFGDEYKVSSYVAAYRNVTVSLPLDYQDVIDTAMLSATCVKKVKTGATAVARKRSKGE